MSRQKGGGGVDGVDWVDWVDGVDDGNDGLGGWVEECFWACHGRGAMAKMEQDKKK
ncbi:MAG: hypothetical protein NTX50_15155 [Candidatus Sumerlaeota bacterium]|nr:hypothetical protein [Candidatus Sumerlaeota bacterium]